eukprot:3316674-Amphidinium_carterae.2
MNSDGQSAKNKLCTGEPITPTLADVMLQLQSIQASLAQIPQLATQVNLNQHDQKIRDLQSRLTAVETKTTSLASMSV